MSGVCRKTGSNYPILSYNLIYIIQKGSSAYKSIIKIFGFFCVLWAYIIHWSDGTVIHQEQLNPYEPEFSGFQGCEWAVCLELEALIIDVPTN